jgi:uncharacterized protein (TIGR02328 family)
MRIWHTALLPYLPDLQFKGQLRELVAIMHDLRDKGTTNHILINKVMEYDKKHLTSYFLRYNAEYTKRYGKWISRNTYWEFLNFADYEAEKDYKLSFANGVDIISTRVLKKIFDGWHTKEYLRSNMANLWEKHFMGVGKSRITDEEWQRLCEGYKNITSEEYRI